ncbi:hypothetical protein KRP22_009179 [Phytophthora ramorum]|nr:hypothetical protein KRP22_8009 [Phytophthora ramorum]
MPSSPARRRAKRPADDSRSSSTASSATSATSPSSQWTRSIQNQSFEPKPTAYSPHSLEDEDPLMLQQRQCRDKLRALRQVRERMQFYPLQPPDKRRPASYSMKISTCTILSERSLHWQSDGPQVSRHNVGIDALGGLEMLLFAFLSRQELLRVSGVCRAWRALGRDDLFWEPLLVTHLERYPLRPLLGLERDLTRQHGDVPAILVYMVYQRLKLAQAAYTQECTDAAMATATTNVATRYNGRFLELFQTLNRQVGALPRSRRIAPGRGNDAASCVHLVGVQYNAAATTRRTQQVTQMAADLNLQVEGGNIGVAAGGGVVNGAVPRLNEQLPVAANAQNGAGAADDEDVYSIADGRDRVTLSSWLSTKRRVSERTMRSYLRQMLLAVDALERSNCEHADISPVNIVVHSQHKSDFRANISAATGSEPQGEESEDEDEDDDGGLDMVEARGCEAKIFQDYRQRSRRRTPFFQLFVSRRNCQHTGGNRTQALDPVLAVDVDMNLPAGMLDLNGGGVREIAQQHHRLAEVEVEAAVAGGGNGGVGGAVAAAFRNRLTLPHPTMVSSVIQIAMAVWCRGRFVDANASPLLALLLRFPGSFSSGLRSFLEYAKYLTITHSATASKLLRHDFLQTPGAQLARQSLPHWSTTPINDINEYKSKLVAYYGSLPSRVEGLLDDNSISSVSPTVIDELMPRTNLGIQYFVKALKEDNLSSERFVSVVAPSTASSSWVRKLACTQTCTLQRLDLSRARVPTSVLLRELATLPRLTHLRLPRQILRDENLEHLVAALAYTDLLPRLRGLDEDVHQAMDRMEKSYLMQLDMVTFLLQKPSASNVTHA